MRKACLLLCLCNLTFLPACGFHPVYGVNTYTPVGVESLFQTLEIGNIPDRDGQRLRNALIDRLYRVGRPSNPAYRLNVQPLQERLIDLDITKTADTTRGQLRLTTSVTLIELATGDTIMERDVQAITSYNILGSEFASRVTEDSARENAVDELARQIERALALYFKRTGV